MILIDTSAWYALFVSDSPHHAAMEAWLAACRDPLLTTDYIVDETLTLLRARGEHQRALEAGQAFFSGQLADLYYLTPDDVFEAWHVFAKFHDKGGASRTAAPNISSIS